MPHALLQQQQHQDEDQAPPASPSWQAIHPASSPPTPSSLLGASPSVSVAAAAAAMTTSSFEIVMPLGELLAEASAAASPASSSSHHITTSSHHIAPSVLSSSMLDVLADQVASSMAAKVGSAAPTEEIADALHELMRRAAAGEPPSAVSVLLGARPTSTPGAASTSATGMAAAAADAPAAASSPVGASPAAAAAAVAPAPLYPSPPVAAPHELSQPPSAATTSVVYRRIPTDTAASRTDPLCGLFLGSFGPHGPELLQLSRALVDGVETVQAIKLTGDANVPAGSVSFRARVGRAHRLDSRDVYPDELGIVARYKGEGLVAQKGFTQPRWVDGELLVFGGHGGPLTGGASLGFVWAVPGEKRFLILLNRVDLNDLAA
jgi:hypothetical protein